MSCCAPASSTSPPPSPTPSLNRLRILLVEDEAATLRLMSRLLVGLGHRVTAAGTVADAWVAVEGGEFDLIVSDIGLPDGTGLDLMRKVKSLGRIVPAIALTGYWNRSARLPSPAKVPYLRGYQAEMAAIGRSWIEHRTGWH